MSTPLDPATFARAILLEASDIPPGMTIAQWRASRRAQPELSAPVGAAPRTKRPSARRGPRWPMPRSIASIR